MNKTWTSALLKENAKKLFKKNYWVCVGVSLLIILFTGSGLIGIGSSGISIIQDIQEIREINNGETPDDPDYEDDYEDYVEESEESFLAFLFPPVLTAIALVGAVLKIFLFNVIEVGGMAFFIQNRTKTPSAGIIFDGFKNGRYMNIIKTMFLRDIQVFLWTFLFIIPGAIKSYEYLMVPYILAENPTMSSKDVLSLSKRMMDGEKGDAFILSLSFIGWDFLSLITCGLAGIFYVNPYYLATFTELYAFNKEKAFDNGYIAQE